MARSLYTSPRTGAVVARALYASPRTSGVLSLPERLAAAEIERERKLYEERGNPLSAWTAYLWAAGGARAGIAMPDWVTAYLIRVAKRMVAMSKAPPSAGAVFAREVRDALELTSKGAGTPAAKRWKTRRDWELAHQVAALVADGHPAYSAIDQVVTFTGLKRSMVKRAYGPVKNALRDGRREFFLRRDQVPDLPPGSTIEGALTPGLPRRTWVVERVLEQDDHLIRVLAVPAPAAPRTPDGQ